MFRLLSAHFPKRIVILAVSEACLVVLAFVAAAMARLGLDDTRVLLSYEQGFLKISVVSVTFITCMYYFDLYDTSIINNRREVATRFLQVLGTVSIVLAFVYYVYPPLQLGRGIFLFGFLLVTIILLLWRRLFFALNSQSALAERALVLGDSQLALSLIHELTSRPELGVRMVGHISADRGGEIERDGEHPVSDGSVGSLDNICQELSRAVKLRRVNRVIVAMDDRRKKLPVQFLLSLKRRGVMIQDGAEIYEAVTGKVPIESIRLSQLLFASGFRVSRFLEVYKRIASILISITGLLLSLPLFPVVVLAIKLTSPGPLFYLQKRVGRDGSVFHCCKFRTMSPDAEADIGPTWASDKDPRITRIGGFFRTTRIDEIPQLWNVLRGDMSLVGPRPERPEFVNSLAREIPLYNLRHTIRPGITGWAQIRYQYGSSVEDSKEKLRYDLFYVKNISPGLDLLILFQTIKIILLGRGAR